MNKRIYIFSRAIRCGKTTALQQWIKSRDNIAGILTPDAENGMRLVIDIATQESFPLQVDEHFAGATTSIGRFHFDNKILRKARQILEAAIHLEPQWLIIDEVGKLETEQHTGLEPAITDIIRHYQSGTGKGKLLLVIRDTLLEKAMDKYCLDGAIIFSDQLPDTNEK